MKVLIACEFSATVRDAFAARGHDAWSTDIIETEGDPTRHIVGDALEILGNGWDLMIAHPPCTYLTKAGVRWLHSDEHRWPKMVDGAKFFKTLLDAPIPMVAVENPVMHRYATDLIGRKQDQVIQPWMFGHAEQKGTALWLRGLPKLNPVTDLRAEMSVLPASVRNRIHWAAPGPNRWKIRSQTFPGIAAAMAEQWGGP